MALDFDIGFIKSTVVESRVFIINYVNVIDIIIDIIIIIIVAAGAGQQVRGRVIAPFHSVVLSYTLYKKILSLPSSLTEAGTPLFLGKKTGYSSTYVLTVHVERR